MSDVVSAEKRSQMMSGIKGRDTKPELLVRKALHALGFRYRLHDAKLPGRPDIVLPKYGAVIQVNGCFWHGHTCKYGKVTPKTRREFWRKKIDQNIARDRRNNRELETLGWRVMVVWECSLRDVESTSAEIDRLIDRIKAKS